MAGIFFSRWYPFSFCLKTIEIKENLQARILNWSVDLRFCQICHLKKMLSLFFGILWNDIPWSLKSKRPFGKSDFPNNFGDVGNCNSAILIFVWPRKGLQKIKIYGHSLRTVAPTNFICVSVCLSLLRLISRWLWVWFWLNLVKMLVRLIVLKFHKNRFSIDVIMTSFLFFQKAIS